MNLPAFIPAKPPVHRKRKHEVQAKAPPVALTLTAASADIEGDFANVTLRFDRAIDVSSMDVTTIRVGTISTSMLYQGTDTPIVVDSKTVQITLTAIDSYDEPNVKLFADSANGIVAVDDGGTWAGTSGLALPFP